MGAKFRKFTYVVSTCFWAALAVLFLAVLLKSFSHDALHMWKEVGLDRRVDGNLFGLTCGLFAYLLFLLLLIFPKIRHNLNWFMHFTHELTHTLVALFFFRRIEEFVVSRRTCHVRYENSPIGFIPITLSPYCIPIYTFMLFPFRFFGASHYMLAFDMMIAFTYAFHIHSFIKQTRFTQSDIEGCGLARSAAFISFINSSVLALILSMPKSGMAKGINRVFWEYPLQFLTHPLEWLQDVLKYI